MSDYEIKATVLGFHPEHGELIAASEAKEAIAHFNDIAKAELAKANDYTAELEVRKEALEESLNGCTEKVLSLSGKLAKANERVTELESELLMLTLATGRESTWQLGKKLLNKFAIEKKIEGVNWFSEKYCDDEHSFLADKAIEQLRKEQEHG